MSFRVDPVKTELAVVHTLCFRNAEEEKGDRSRSAKNDVRVHHPTPVTVHQKILLSELKHTSSPGLVSYWLHKKGFAWLSFSKHSTCPCEQITTPQALQRRGYLESSGFSEGLVPWLASVSSTCGPPAAQAQSSICKLQSPPRWEWRSLDTLARTNPRNEAWLPEEGERSKCSWIKISVNMNISTMLPDIWSLFYQKGPTPAPALLEFVLQL